MLQKQITIGFIHNNNNPVIQETYNGYTFPDFGIGFYLYGEKFYTGLSSTHITNPKIKMSAFDYTLTRHFYFIAGKKIVLTEKLFLEPSFLIKSDFAVNALDLNLNINYRNLFFTGVGFRAWDTVIFLAGCNIANFRLSYSFEYGISGFSKYFGNSHEIVLGYSLKQKESN